MISTLRTCSLCFSFHNTDLLSHVHNIRLTISPSSTSLIYVCLSLTPIPSIPLYHSSNHRTRRVHSLTSNLDPTLSLSTTLTANTQLPVLTHTIKKPSCGPEIMAYFAANPETGVTHPSQIAVVGDRISTDVMLANSMGAYSIFVRDGVMGREKLTMVRILPSVCSSWCLV